MSNNDIYLQAFTDIFNMPVNKIYSLNNNSEEWDSVAHIELIAAIEKRFNITLTAEDMLECSSFVEGKSVLKKYGIIFEK